MNDANLNALKEVGNAVLAEVKDKAPAVVEAVLSSLEKQLPGMSFGKYDLTVKTVGPLVLGRLRQLLHGVSIQNLTAPVL
jgi:hypothetical protein